MKYVVELSQQARSDVRAIGRWLDANRTTEIADRWMRAFARVITLLEADPRRFPLADESTDLGMQLHEHHLGSRTNAYRLLFEVSGHTVRIIRVWHSARDSLSGGDI